MVNEAWDQTINLKGHEVKVQGHMMQRPGGCHLTLVIWGDSRAYAVLQKTLDKDCRQAEEPKQLVDEASRFHLGRQRQHSAIICSGALLFSSRVLRPSLVTLCSHKSGRCAVELYRAFHLWYPPFYTSPMASSALQH